MTEDSQERGAPSDAESPSGSGVIDAQESLAGSFPLPASPQLGYGHSIAHHGEILQGFFEAADGKLHRGLVTLPCHMWRSSAVFHPEPGPLRVQPTWRIKALKAARLTLDLLGFPEVGGRLSIDASIPVRWGLGSSTSDVIAAIRAVAYAFHARLPSRVVAQLAVRAEVASDSVMFDDRAVLFAHRDGFVLEDFSLELPPIDVLGLNTDLSGSGVDTLLMPPPQYTWREVQSFRPLLGLLRHAVHRQDPCLLGQVALASARINQRYLAKPCFDRLEALAEAVGSVGIQVAHSGSIIGILFDSRVSDKNERVAQTRAKVGEMGFRWIWSFSNSRSPISPGAPQGAVFETPPD